MSKKTSSPRPRQTIIPRREWYHHWIGHHNARTFATIDPGARAGGGTGVAIFNSKTMQYVNSKLIAPIDPSNRSRSIELMLIKIRSFLPVCTYCNPIFIEEPQFFDTFKGHTAARSESLFKLIFFYGRLYEALVQRGNDVIPVRIIDWKGQLSKRQVENRVQRITGVAFKGDVADAVGIGLYIRGDFS